MRGFQFYVRHPDGRTEEYKIENERVLVGTGAHCDIRLPVDQGAIDHVAVLMSASTVVVEVLSVEPPPTINGAPIFHRSQLLPDAILGIGQMQFKIGIVDIHEAAPTVTKEKQKTNPLIIVLGIVMIPLALYLLFMDVDVDSKPPPPKQVPDLWPAPITVCQQKNPQQALALAEDQFALAVARRERRPFKVQEGVKAVPLFETAAACFEVAQNKDAARQASDAAKLLRKQVGDDFHSHRIRMEHTLHVKDFDTALKEVRVLLQFTEGLQGDYVNWLSALERSLQLDLGKTNKP